MSVTAVLGAHRGDEGKGRVVDNLLESGKFEIAARFNGGPNAGHTVILPDNTEFQLHHLPCGAATDGVANIIGNGTYVHPVKLVEELADLSKKGIEMDERTLLLSSAAHLILPHHISKDEIKETGAGRQGTTKSGISLVGAAKGERTGFQVGEIVDNLDGVLEFAYSSLVSQRAERSEAGLPEINEKEILDQYREAALKIGKLVTDTVYYLHCALNRPNPANVLAEGAQAYLLDNGLGMYPYVTSSYTTIGGVLTGLGVNHTHIEKVINVAKAIPSHVGGGPFVTEISDPDLLEQLHGDMSAVDAEKGTTTGRVRRLGYFDIPVLKMANMVNGANELVITKLDWLNRFTGEIPVCVGYSRKDGKYHNGSDRLEAAPTPARDLELCEPILQSVPGFSEDISTARSYDELPSGAKQFVEIIEEYTNLPVTAVGVGPRRDQLIVR